MMFILKGAGRKIGDTMDKEKYGVYETNAIEDPKAWSAWLATVTEVRRLEDTDLVKITRLRLLTEPGYPFYDISYCYGELKDGTPCRVQLDEMSLSRRTPKGDLIAMAKRAKRYAKGMGLLDEANWSMLIG